MRGAIVLLAGLALAAPATAAPPVFTASASPSTGVAPLRVTLAASGDAAAYTWDLGDGTTASGAIVTHVYRAGRFTATVTATSAAGEVTQAQVQIAAQQRTLSLAAPRTADFGAAATLTGVLRPAARGARVQIYRANTYVTSARVGPSGRFRAHILLRSPGPYHVRFGGARSPARTIALRPQLQAGLPRGRSRRRHADSQPEARSGTRGIGSRAHLPRRAARPQPGGPDPDGGARARSGSS